MPRRKYTSPEEIQERIAKANEMRKRKAALKAEYDKAYRSSFYFKASVVVRALLILYSVYLFTLDDIYFYTRVDVLDSVQMERKVVYSKRSKKYTEFYANLHTTANKYYSVYMGEGSYEEVFSPGDTIVVQHTVLGKASYIATTQSAWYYPTTLHRGMRFYMLIGAAVSVLSLFMISGYDVSSRLFVRFAFVAAGGMFLIYLVL